MKKEYFNLARKLSHRSEHPQHKMGCVIVNKHNIISIGFNSLKTHRKSNSYDNRLHAEIDALIGLSYEETSGGTIYIYRERKDGTLGLARPCTTCMEALKRAGIKKICYTDYDGFKEEKI